MQRGVLDAQTFSPQNDRTRVMGIVNVTPDSFSDGGRYIDPAAAVSHACRLMEEGADLVDLGAESTRPGATPMTAQAEWARLEPVLGELCGVLHFPVSVDTYHAETAHRALEAGAVVINDVWGGLADPDILRVAAEAGCTYVWMHNRERPAPDGFAALLEETRVGVERCLNAGIKETQLWIDPGIGFGKTRADNLTVLRRLDEYCRIGYPVLLGSSRKRVVGETLGIPAQERLEGSLATVALGVWAGVSAVRVHDVLATVRTCRMVEAIAHSDLGDAT